MRGRSTGLGKTEIEMEISDIKKVDDLVIFYADVVKPVKWRTRMAFQEKDWRPLVRAILKPRNLWFGIRALFSNEGKVHKTEEF